MSRSAEKIERGDSLVSPGMVCYAEKQVKPFWSNSLGQMVQFDTIIFCRTFKNYFGQFVWIEKKRVTIIVAFHFMKRRLKKWGYVAILSVFPRFWTSVLFFFLFVLNTLLRLELLRFDVVEQMNKKVDLTRLKKTTPL